MSNTAAIHSDLAPFGTPPTVETALEEGERIAAFVETIPPNSRGPVAGLMSQLESDLQGLRKASPGALTGWLHASQIVAAWPLILDAVKRGLEAPASPPPVQPAPTASPATPASGARAVAATPPPWPRLPMLFFAGLPLGKPRVPPATITDAMMGVTLAAEVRARIPKADHTSAMRVVEAGTAELCHLGLHPNAAREREVSRAVLAAYPTAFHEACAYLSAPKRQRAFAAAKDEMVEKALRVLEEPTSRVKTEAPGITARVVGPAPLGPAPHTSQLADLKPHPLAAMFPEITGEAFDKLVEDIKTNGLLEHIMLLDGEILDGWNRYRACKVAGLAPMFEAYTGDDPIAFVIAKNLKRRHLDASQRADLGARLMNLFDAEAKERQRAGGLQKGRAKLPEAVARPREKAAALVGASPRSVQDAASIRFGARAQPPAVPEVIAAVQAGKLPVSQGVKLAREAPETQRQVLAAVNAGEKPSAAMAVLKRTSTASTKNDVPVAVTQDASLRSAMSRLRDDAQEMTDEWAKTDPVGMKLYIAVYTKVAAALTEALDALPNPPEGAPGLAKATSRTHKPAKQKKDTTRALKKAASRCSK